MQLQLIWIEKELWEWNHLAVTEKNKHLTVFCFNFCSTLCWFLYTESKRNDEVMVKQTEIIFWCIVLVFTASLVFCSQRQIDQTSAVWLKYFFKKKSHIVKLRQWSRSATETVFSACTRLATEACLSYCTSSMFKQLE